MVSTKYTISSPSLNQSAGLSAQDTAIFSENFESTPVTLNSVFNPSTDYVEIQAFNLNNTLIRTVNGIAQVSDSSNSSSTVYLDPLTVVQQQFPNTSVKLVYSFLRNIVNSQFYISGISPDRSEIKIKTLGQASELNGLYDALTNKLTAGTYLPKLFLELTQNSKVLILNVDRSNQEILLKLYTPLEVGYGIKSSVRFIEEIADSVTFTVNVATAVEPPKSPVLRGPNFNIELEDQSDLTTEYLDYTDLLSFPVTASYNRIYAEASGSGVNINVDYSDFENFVHFSSAKERLVNFKYKLDLIHSYEAARALNSTVVNANTAVRTVDTKYSNLIKGVIENFDGYERHLYFKSGSTSWPKTNNTLPYLNEESTSTQAEAWFEGTLSSASLYDELNESRLKYTLPEYIRQDSNNDPAGLFLDMVGQHFDHLWVYAKGITDKYDADNRLDYGISKDLIVKTLQNFGVKLYSSNFSSANLSKLLLGEWYDSGSEEINTFVTASNNPTPDSDLLFETYKRIYHNLPYLVKTKGTPRGLRALINCFGIPSGSIQIREYGGLPTTLEYSPGYDYPSQPSEKIRLSNTGSIVPGDTLSYYTSINKPANEYTQDLHVAEIGFSPSYYLNDYIVHYTLPSDYVSGTDLKDLFAYPNFRIDDYVGDPRNVGKREHTILNKYRDRVLANLEKYDVYDFIRLIKFFDNQLFKMIKDFVPARDTVSTGVIIKPHLLDRSKTGEPVPTGERSEYSASIDTAFVEGSEPGVIADFSVAHSQSLSTNLGIITEFNNTEVEKINGELGGTNLVVTNGQLNDENLFKQLIIPACDYTVTEYLDGDGIIESSFLNGYPISAGNISMFWASATGFATGNYVKYIKIHFTPGTGDVDFTTSFQSGVTSVKIGNVVYTPEEITVGTNAALLRIPQTKTSGISLNPAAYPKTTLNVNVLITPFVTERFDNSDYNPLFNNATEIDTATRLQKVDYGNGVVPTNIEAIRNNTADAAEIQEYLHGSIGMRTGRYLGRELTGRQINVYNEGDVSYGRTPVIENKSIFFTYFNEITETNAELLNHVQADLRYIVDKEGTYRDITIGSDDYYNLQQSLPAGSLATLSLDNPVYLGFNMVNLNGDHKVKQSGATVTPIAYSYSGSLQNYTGSITFGEDITVDDFRGTYMLSATGASTYTKKDQGHVIEFDKIIKNRSLASYDNDPASANIGEYSPLKTPEFDLYFNATYYIDSLDNSNRAEKFEPIIEWFDTSDSTWKQLQHVLVALGGTARPASSKDQAAVNGAFVGAAAGAAGGTALAFAAVATLNVVLGALTLGASAPLTLSFSAALLAAGSGLAVGSAVGAGAGQLTRLLAVKDPYVIKVDGRSADNMVSVMAFPKLRKSGTVVDIQEDDRFRVRAYSATGDFQINGNSALKVFQEKDPAVDINSTLFSMADLSKNSADPIVNAREYITEDFDVTVTLPPPFNVTITTSAGDTLSDAYGLIQSSTADGFTTPSVPFTVEVGDEIRFGLDESRVHTITEVYRPGQVWNYQTTSGTSYASSGSLIMRVSPPIPSAYTSSAALEAFTLRRYVPSPKTVLLTGTKASGSTSGGILKAQHITDETAQTLKDILPNLRKDANN